jgi:hypothetical protein
MNTIELEQEVTSVPQRAKGMVVRTAEDYIAAGELLKVIKGLRAEVDGTFDPIIEKANASHKEAIAQKKKVEAPLVDAEAILKPRIAAYLQEEERKRREAELLAHKRAQEEAEAQQLADAALLDDIGETALANAKLEEKPYVAPVVLPKATPKVAGISMTQRYSAQVVNVMELCKAVVAGKVPVLAIQANQPFLNAQARAMKESMNYPGVRVVVEGNVSARR